MIEKKKCNAELKFAALKIGQQMWHAQAEASINRGIPNRTVDIGLVGYTMSRPGLPAGELSRAELKDENARLRKERLLTVWSKT